MSKYLLIIGALFLSCICIAADGDKAKYEQEADKRIKGFKLTAGMKATLWADKSQVMNPSAFYFDSKGRFSKNFDKTKTLQHQAL